MAAGDITLTSPKVTTVTGLQLAQIAVTTTEMQVTLIETATGFAHVVRINNGSCIGVDYTAGVFTDNVPRAVSGEFTKLRNLLFQAGAQSTLMTTLVADGVLTVAGAVG